MLEPKLHILHNVLKKKTCREYNIEYSDRTSFMKINYDKYQNQVLLHKHLKKSSDIRKTIFPDYFQNYFA